MIRGRALRRGLSRQLLLGVLLTLLTGCMIPIPTVQPLTLIDPVDELRTAEREDADRGIVRLRLLSKKLTVRGADDISLFRGWFRYNVAEWIPSVKDERDAGVVSLTVTQGLGSQIPLGKHDEYLNEWDIELARGVPLDLGIDIGAGEAQLDLTGLALEKLSVTSGSTDLSIAFAAPNPQPLGMLRVTAGAGKVVASGLGNANFDHLSVFGGAGTVDLDFGGAFQRSAIADVKAGAGRVSVRVPETLGVRVTLAGVPISGVDTLGFSERGDKVYVNAAYGDAPLTLSLKITTGIGSISLISQ